MRLWQWILKWLTIRDYEDMKAIERAIGLMSKLLPVLQGLILGTWTFAIAFKWSLTLYLWIEIAVTVIVGVGVVGLRSRVARQRDKVNDNNEKEISEEQKKIIEERKRRRAEEAKRRQSYDLSNRRRYVQDRLFVPEPFIPEEWDDTETIAQWNARITELQDAQRRTRREADVIESEGRGLVRTAIVLFVVLSIIFTLTWSFKWGPSADTNAPPCCPLVQVSCPSVHPDFNTCFAGVDIQLDSLVNIANELKLKLVPTFNFGDTIVAPFLPMSPHEPGMRKCATNSCDVMEEIKGIEQRLDSLFKLMPTDLRRP
jgi:hypothetical protein